MVSRTPPSVSVVIPTYNREKSAIVAATSALNQTTSPFEVIVVDDASMSFYRTLPKMAGITYIRLDKNRGANACRNAGIQIAKGDLVAFLDDDDEWLPQKIEKQLQQLDDTGRQILYTGRTIQSRNGARYTFRTSSFPRIAIQVGNFIGSTSSVMVSRELLEHAAGFDGALSSRQDWDLYYRLIIEHDAIPAGCNEALVLYSDVEGGRISTNWRKILSASGYLAKKYGPKLFPLAVLVDAIKNLTKMALFR